MPAATRMLEVDFAHSFRFGPFGFEWIDKDKGWSCLGGMDVGIRCAAVPAWKAIEQAEQSSLGGVDTVRRRLPPPN